jgi:hypothetical protein
VAAYNWLEPIILGLGDYGKLTIPELLGIPAWVAITTLAIVAGIGFWLLERYEVMRVSGHGLSKGTPSWPWSSRKHQPIVGGQ